MSAITYLGTADDVVQRYPWKKGCSMQEINNQLIHAIIYDQKLALNDGYLIANPEFLDSLNNISRSLLGNALTLGNVILFSRSKNQNLVETMVESSKRIKTHRHAFEKKEGKHLIYNLNLVQKEASFITWPQKNMGAIFAKLLEQLYEKDRLHKAVPEDPLKKDFDKIYSCFVNDMNRNFNEARQHWERLCWRHFENLNIDKYDPNDKKLSKKKNYSKICSLMQVANEAYHLAYSAGLYWSIKENDDLTYSSTKPLTAICPAYFDLFETEKLPEKGHMNIENLEKLLISVDLLIFKEKGNYWWLRDFVYDPELNALRSTYLDILNKYVYGFCTFKEAFKHANAYKKKIASIIAEEVPTKTDLIEKAVNFFGVHQVVSLLQLVEDTINTISITEPLNIDPIKAIKKRVEVYEVKQLLGKRQRNASRYIQPIQHARKLGLINCNLDSEAINNLLANIHPWDPNLGKS